MEPRSQHRNSNQPATRSAEGALRCECGNLLARIVAEGVEIKCRRCKRCVIVPRDAKGIVKISL
jgi:hypothetical protein